MRSTFILYSGPECKIVGLEHTYTEKVGRILEIQPVFNNIVATYAAFFAIVVGLTLNSPHQNP